MSVTVVVGGCICAAQWCRPLVARLQALLFWDTQQLSFDNYLTVCGAALFVLC